MSCNSVSPTGSVVLRLRTFLRKKKGRCACYSHARSSSCAPSITDAREGEVSCTTTIFPLDRSGEYQMLSLATMPVWYTSCKRSIKRRAPSMFARWSAYERAWHNERHSNEIHVYCKKYIQREEYRQ